MHGILQVVTNAQQNIDDKDKDLRFPLPQSSNEDVNTLARMFVDELETGHIPQITLSEDNIVIDWYFDPWAWVAVEIHPTFINMNWYLLEDQGSRIIEYNNKIVTDCIDMAVNIHHDPQASAQQTFNIVNRKVPIIRNSKQTSFDTIQTSISDAVKAYDNGDWELSRQHLSDALAVGMNLHTFMLGLKDIQTPGGLDSEPVDTETLDKLKDVIT